MMRVDAYNTIANIYSATKPTNVKNSKSTVGKDEVQISRAGKDYQFAKQAVAQSADIREERVTQLKARVDSGEYKVEPGDFASKLMEKYTANL